MTTWLGFRYAKYVGIALFGAGLWSAVSADEQRRRLTAAHVLAPAGFVMSWLAGYGLMKLSARSVTEPWIIQGMLASVVAWVGALLAASRPSATPLGTGLVAAGLAASIGAMVGRGTAAVALVWVVPGVLGVSAALAIRRLPAAVADPLAGPRTLKWFAWVARMEGTSLLILVGIAMPVRMMTGVSLDGGQGWIGWTHGVLVFLFLPSWIVASRAGRWRPTVTALAFVGSLIPLGTFAFEWRYLRRQSTASLE